MKNTPDVDRKAAHQAHVMARLSFLVLGFALAFIATLAYWATANENLYSKIDGVTDEIRIVDRHGKAGGTITVSLSYCKTQDVPVRFTRSFISNSTVISNPVLVDDTGSGCIEDRMVEVPVPSEAGTGDYRLRYTVTASINPLKKEIAREYYSHDTVHITSIADQKGQ